MDPFFVSVLDQAKENFLPKLNYQKLYLLKFANMSCVESAMENG